MKRLPMRKIREALRLRADGFSGRRVAQSLALGRATISDYFRRADVEGLSWPLPADLSDADLEQRLFSHFPGEVRRGVPQPDWAYVHTELRRKGVTLSLLWEEYRGVHSYTSLHSILKNGLDRKPRTRAPDEPAINGVEPFGYEYICKIWTSEPDRFILNPIHQMPGLNT